MYEQTYAEKFELANKWIRLQNKDISILQHLKTKGIDRIVLYGASEFCMRLIEQYEKENKIVEIIGIVDKNISSKGEFYKGIPLIPIEDILELYKDNFVVVTAMGFYKEIEVELKDRGINNFMSLKELIYDVYC